MRYSIEFEPTDPTHTIRLLHLCSEQRNPLVRFKAYWSRMMDERRIGARADCHVNDLLGFWRHLRAYTRWPRMSKSGTILPCVYDLPIVRYHELLGHFSNDEFKELANFLIAKKTFRLEILPCDVPLFTGHVSEMLRHSTGFPPRL